MDKNLSSLNKFIHSQLEILDASLCKANEPVHRRPMLAAMQFVTECLVKVGDEEIGADFLERAWFGQILAVTTKWYTNRYGRDMLKTPSGKITGVVAAFGTPLSLEIPQISEFETSKPAVKKIIFADGVLDEEDPMDWVTPAPSLNEWNANDATALCTHVTQIATLLRQVHRRILVAEFASTEEEELASSVEGHLEKGAADIVAGRYGAAVWDIHLGIEKILKVYVRQRGASVTRSHDLTQLVAEAEQSGLPSCRHLNLNRLPPHGAAIQHRYAELPPPTFDGIMEIYEIAIHLIAHVAGALRQSSFADHKELYIRALPWHPKWNRGEANPN